MRVNNEEGGWSFQESSEELREKHVRIAASGNLFVNSRRTAVRENLKVTDNCAAGSAAISRKHVLIILTKRLIQYSRERTS